MEALADHLELKAPRMPWHTDRTPVWEVVWAVDRPVASTSKMATDVAHLAQSDTAELTVRAGGSSSVPDKRNPIDAIRALAAADMCHGAAEMILGARPHELDRALGAWHVEWVALPLLFRSASAALEAAASMFETMKIDGAAMDSRVDNPPGELDVRQVDGVLQSYEEIIGET
jgi:3-carboxy-cis,cis-muconate cycloisomerase